MKTWMTTALVLGLTLVSGTAFAYNAADACGGDKKTDSSYCGGDKKTPDARCGGDKKTDSSYCGGDKQPKS